MNTTELLIKARSILKNGGLHKGQYRQKRAGRHVAHCTIGACHAAAKGRFDAGPVYTALQECLPSGYSRITTYNDSPSTTKKDILNLFDRAIAISKETLA